MKKFYPVFIVILTVLSINVFSQSIIFSEIMYNDPSSGTTGDSLEFIEIYNNSTETVNLVNYQVSYGVKITFPAVLFAPNEYIVIAKNANAVQNFFGITGVLQWVAGDNLSNTGEALVLSDGIGTILDSLYYLPTAPWPLAGNGYGASILKCDPLTPGINGSSWIAAMPSNANDYSSLAGCPVFANPGSGCTITTPYSPTLASFPFHESFNQNWINGDHYRDVPNTCWQNAPASLNNSWRREDDGFSSSWTNPTTGTFSPSAAMNSLHSARFHTAGCTAGSQGILDLHIFLGVSGFKKLSFWYINSAGTDSLAVWVSYDNGNTFSFIQKFTTTSNGWEKKQISLGLNTGNYGIIRFRATSNAGTSDIGIDEVDVGMTPNDDAGVAEIVTPSTFLTNLTDSVRVRVKNYGNNDIYSLTVNWQVNGIPQTPVALSGSLMAAGLSPIINLGQYTFSSGSTSIIKAWTSQPNGHNDNDNTNDTLAKPVYFQSYASIPFTETFENQWLDKQGAHDAPSEFWINTPVSGNNSWRRVDDGATAAWTNTATGLYTPAGANGSSFSARFHTGAATTGTQGTLNLYANFSTPGSKRLTFWHLNTSGSDSLAVWISTDNGDNFTFLQKFTMSGATWAQRKIDIGEISSSTVVIRFRATGTAGTNPTDIGLDDVQLSLIPPFNAGILSITSPNTVLTSQTDTVKVIFKNFGGDTLTNVDFHWEINGIPQPDLQWTGSLPSLAVSGVFTLGAYTFPSGTISTIKVWTFNPNTNPDTEPANDTATKTVYYQSYASIPFFESFDNTWINKQATRDVPGFYWMNSPITGSNSWRRNDDGASANWTNANVGAYAIPGANGTSNSARFHTGGSTGGQIGYLYLYVNMSMPGDKELRYWHINTAGQDSLAISISQDGGANYSFVQKYAVAATWTQHMVSLGNISSPNTIIRFRVTSNANGNTDVGLDEVSVTPVLPDAGITKLLAPVSGCAIAANTDMIVRVKNFSSLPISNIPVHSPAGVFTITNTLQPGDSIDFLVGTTTITAGTIANLTFYTTLTDDIFKQNDTLKAKVTSYAPINTFPFLENFDSGSTPYFSFQGASNAKVNINTSLGNQGTPGLLMTGLVAGTWPGGTGTSTTASQAFGYADHAGKAYSSCIVDATSLSNPELKIDLKMGNSSGWAYSYFRVVVNDTVPLADNLGNTNFNSASNNSDPFVTHTFDLSAYANTQFKLTFQSACKYDNTNGQNGFGDNVYLDNIRIQEKLANDAGIIALVSPVSSCDLTAMEMVTITIGNFGTNTINMLPISYSINGGPVITELLMGNIAPGTTTNFTFANIAMLQFPGTYVFTINIGADMDPSNNTLQVTVVNSPYITTYSYFEDFEGANSGWFSGAISGPNDWELGTPAQAVINTAHSGNKAWMTGLAANYHDNTNCYIQSPCFDFTTLTNPMLSVWLFLKTELNYDAMILEASDNGGAWTKVTGTTGFYNNTSTQGNITPPKWSGSTTGWTQFSTSVSSFVGSAKVQFRFRFAADYVQNDEGIAIDDFTISEKVLDLSLVSIMEPTGGCDAISPSPVTISVSNFGFGRSDSLVTRMKVDNGAYVYETHHDTLNPGETKTILLTSLADLSIPGQHLLTVGVFNPQDLFHQNDSLTVTLYTTAPITSPPLFTNFESPGYFAYFGIGFAQQAMVSVENNIGQNLGHAILMTGGTAGTWPADGGTSTTYSQAFGYADHFANIYTCDVNIPLGVPYALYFHLRQTFSEGPKTSWLRVMMNDTTILAENFSGDTTFNPITANADAWTPRWFIIPNNGAPVRLSIQAANKFYGAYSPTGIGDNAIIDNLGIGLWFGTPEHKDREMIVYPNPATDYLNVECSKTIGTAFAEIRNIHGQLMLTTNISGKQQFSLDLKSLPAGVYSLTVKEKSASRTIKFVHAK